MSEYALFSAGRNRFVISSTEHEKLKFLQLLVMDYELLYLVDLSGISNYRPGLFDDGRCFKTTLANAGSRIEIDMYISDPSYRIIPVRQEPSDNDIEFKEKLLFLLSFIGEISNISDQLLCQNQKQFENHRRGLEVFKKFLAMTMPEDRSIQDFIDREIANKDVTGSVKERLQGEIFKRLKEMDYNLSLSEFKQLFSTELDTIPMISNHFKEAVVEIKKVLA